MILIAWRISEHQQVNSNNTRRIKEKRGLESQKKFEMLILRQVTSCTAAVFTDPVVGKTADKAGLPTERCLCGRDRRRLGIHKLTRLI
jgi:hypothetical protein